LLLLLCSCDKGQTDGVWRHTKASRQHGLSVARSQLSVAMPLLLLLLLLL
jgi:hypothetical protein